MDEPHEKLRKARIARGYANASDAAKAHGWKYQTYLAHENGTRGIRAVQARRYERALGISAGELLGIQAPTGKLVDTSRVEVVGEAAAGVWREDRIDTDQQRIAIISTPMGARGWAMRKAVRVADSSMELVGIMPGDYAVYVTLDRQLKDHDIVYVRRSRGGLTERSIRQVRTSDDGKISLTCRAKAASSGTTPVPYPGARGETVEIIGRVVGSYRDL